MIRDDQVKESTSRTPGSAAPTLSKRIEWGELAAVALILASLAGTLNLVISVYRRNPGSSGSPAPPAVVAQATADGEPAEATGPVASVAESKPEPEPELTPEPEPSPPTAPKEPDPPPEDPTRLKLAELATATEAEIAGSREAEKKALSIEKAAQAANAQAQQWKRRESLIRGRMAAIANHARALEIQTDEVALERDVLARERDALKAALAKVDSRSSYAVLPFKGPNGTWKRPIILECVGASAKLQPKGPTFSMLDLSPLIHPRTSPVVQALAREMAKIQAGETPDGAPAVPYLVFLVRPDGIRAYYEARARLEPLGISFGYELVPQDLEIQFPDLDDTSTWDGSMPLDVPRPILPSDRVDIANSSSGGSSSISSPSPAPGLWGSGTEPPRRDHMLGHPGLLPADSANGQGPGGNGGSADPIDEFVWPTPGQRLPGRSRLGRAGALEQGLADARRPGSDSKIPGMRAEGRDDLEGTGNPGGQADRSTATRGRQPGTEDFTGNGLKPGPNGEGENGGVLGVEEPTPWPNAAPGGVASFLGEGNPGGLGEGSAENGPGSGAGEGLQPGSAFPGTGNGNGATGSVDKPNGQNGRSNRAGEETAGGSPVPGGEIEFEPVPSRSPAPTPSSSSSRLAPLVEGWTRSGSEVPGNLGAAGRKDGEKGPTAVGRDLGANLGPGEGPDPLAPGSVGLAPGPREGQHLGGGLAGDGRGPEGGGSRSSASLEQQAPRTSESHRDATIDGETGNKAGSGSDSRSASAGGSQQGPQFGLGSPFSPPTGISGSSAPAVGLGLPSGLASAAANGSPIGLPGNPDTATTANGSPNGSASGTGTGSTTASETPVLPSLSASESSPLKIEAPFEMVVVCDSKGLEIHPGNYRITRSTLAANSPASTHESLFLRHLRSLERQRALVDPMIRPRPKVKFLIAAGGEETYWEARRQLRFSGLEWPMTFQLVESQLPQLFARERW
jgi:hypothetical protein